MPENPQTPNKKVSADWLVQGVLTKIGSILDGLTGRSWRPSSSLATSELIETLKRLMESEVRENGDKRKFVPHNIRLKMQWDKFSTDSDEGLKMLETELLTAAIDFINDKRYYTYAPLSLQVKPDYFTSGVKLFVGFEEFDEGERDAEISVAIPGAEPLPSSVQEVVVPTTEIAVVRFTLEGVPVSKKLLFEQGRRLSVGRTKQNDLVIDDASVSKIHASLLLNDDGQIVVADTGSTNGTFVRDERISYGKAVQFNKDEKVKFGTVEVSFEFEQQPAVAGEVSDPLKTKAYRVGEFEFTQRIAPDANSTQRLEKTLELPEEAETVEPDPGDPNF